MKRHIQTQDNEINSLESDGQTSKAIKDGAHSVPSLQVLGMTFTTLVGCKAILYYPCPLEWHWY